MHDAVKPFMSLNRPAVTDDVIRQRLSDALDALQVDKRGRYAWVADRTGRDRRQVRKWLTGETRSFPATFAAELHHAGIISVQKLLLGCEGGGGSADADEAAVEAMERAIRLLRDRGAP